MSDSIKVSVIIPIYGVEKYIERCVRSLFSQTLENMEFIFVDDCTKDNSIVVLQNVIKEFPKRRSQVIIIKHDKNQGLPQARKTGIHIARGEYIAHCDSDDWVEPDMYRLMFEKAKEESADIICCNYYKTDGLHIKKEIQIRPTHYLLTGPVWNKLVKHELYKNDIIYPTAGKAEDGALMVQLSYYSHKVVYITRTLYNYFQNPESICRVMSEEAMLKRLNEEKQNVDLRIDFLRKKGVIEKYSHEVLMWKKASRNNLLPYYHKRQYRKLWRNTYPEINGQILKDAEFGITEKMSFIADYIGLHKFWNRVLKVVLIK